MHSLRKYIRYGVCNCICDPYTGRVTEKEYMKVLYFSGKNSQYECLMEPREVQLLNLPFLLYFGSTYR